MMNTALATKDKADIIGESITDINVTGKQAFMGKEIPVVCGGFGENKKCISDKTIAEIHEMQTKHVRERISQNIKRFKENIDFVDLKQRVGLAGTLELLLSLGYAKQSITQAEHIYILSERGYAKLIKIMDTDLAWEIHDNLMDEYFTMKENAILPKDYPSALRAYADEYERHMLAEREKQVLAEQNGELQAQLDTSKDWYSIKRVAAMNGVPWMTFSWRKLKNKGIKMGYEVKKIFDANYGEVNTYHRDVWEAAYPKYEI